MKGEGRVNGKALLRRGEARALLGVSDRQFRRLLAGGMLARFYWGGRGRALFARVQVDAVAAGNVSHNVARTGGEG